MQEEGGGTLKEKNWPNPIKFGWWRVEKNQVAFEDGGSAKDRVAPQQRSTNIWPPSTNVTDWKERPTSQSLDRRWDSSGFTSGKSFSRAEKGFGNILQTTYCWPLLYRRTITKNVRREATSGYVSLWIYWHWSSGRILPDWMILLLKNVSQNRMIWIRLSKIDGPN